MRIITFTTLLLSMLPAAPAAAGGLLWARQVIYGMDCAPCAYGIEQGLKKLPGIRSVTVSLNEGYAEIALVPESATNIGAVRDVVRRNGFTPKSAEARIVGMLEIDNGKLYLNTVDTRLEVAASTELRRSLESLVGRQVTLAGRVPADRDNRLVVQAMEIKPET